MGAISALQQQVQSLQAELNAIREEILKYKYREAASLISSNHAALVSSADAISAAIPANSQPQGLSQLPPPPLQKQLPAPPLKPLPSPSVILSSFSSSSTSSVYTPKSSMSLGSISTTENVPYFV